MPLIFVVACDRRQGRRLLLVRAACDRRQGRRLLPVRAACDRRQGRRLLPVGAASCPSFSCDAGRDAGCYRVCLLTDPPVHEASAHHMQTHDDKIDELYADEG